MKKRILCLFLSLCLLIGAVAFSFTALAGEETETYYVIDAVRDGDTYVVTVKCNWTDYEMLNGEFLFTYPTDELELILEDDSDIAMNRMSPLSGAEVAVNTATGEVRLAFISSDGMEFADGWMTMLVMPFRLLHEDVDALNIQMSTETLVAAGDQPGEKVNVLEQEEIPAEVTFEKSVAEAQTAVSTTTTTTATGIGTTTTAPLVEPAVGAEHYAVDVFVAGTRAVVTVKCDYTDLTVLNGQFMFAYPTDTLDPVIPQTSTGRDNPNKLSELPSRAVRVEEALGEVHIAFMSTGGSEFLDGPVTAFKAEFDILDTQAASFELVMNCSDLVEYAADDARGRDLVAAGEMPSALKWVVSLEQTPTTTEPTTTTTTTAPLPPAPPKILGDVNGSNTVDSTDARLTLQCAVGKITASALDTAMADVNGDNNVDSTDARLILQYAVKKIAKFPIQ